MRDLANQSKIVEFMRAFARNIASDVRVYFTGGATAVLMGWRDSTVDVDLRFDPELDELFRSIPRIKEELQVNVELAAPSDFIPQLPGWETRSKYIGREGKVSYYHYDPYSQALSKIERGHRQDVLDVSSMLDTGLIDRARLWELFKEIEPLLYKYPAIDPDSFSRAVLRVVDSDHK
ncbi:MAG: hypothetical protein HOP17_10675 [Acidobacteria bacterium]|nr:hypothetical protein [Acidobacteriota bacterium]